MRAILFPADGDSCGGRRGRRGHGGIPESGGGEIGGGGIAPLTNRSRKEETLMSVLFFLGVSGYKRII